MIDDNSLYSASKEYVKKCLSGIYNKSEKHIIISISRKGPKFLELLFNKDKYHWGNAAFYDPKKQLPHNNAIYNTITEVALPFYFLKLTREKKNPSEVVIFDDAIYFGTTVEGICKELTDFERLYKLSLKKELYTAIRSKEAKSFLQLGNVNIHSFNNQEKIDLRPGYGHYFIKRLEEDLSLLNNTLEVEFPIIEFEADKPIEKETLFKTLQNHYESEIAFGVKHCEQTSISIILDDKAVNKGQSFRKIRIYVNDNIIRVVCIAPWILPNDMSMIARLFENSQFQFIWQKLLRAYTYFLEEQRNFQANYFLSIERCIRKSLVVVANYILSFRLLLEERTALSSIFNSTSSNINYKGINPTDLFYLLGDIIICNEIKDFFNKLWNNNEEISEKELTPNIKPLDEVIDYQVFENENFPERDELKIFQKHNQMMLTNSQNINEAMSALFFNQTSLIEKWSRRSEKYDFGRLRFGYTYHSLYRDLINAGKMEPTKNNRRIVNQWMDRRIDQACIVPQYVIDRRTNQWCRVFRPGENEDALLNHLARYVLAVFKIIESVQGLGWVYEYFLREMLCLSVMTENEEWQKTAFEFELIADIDNRTLIFKYGNQNQSRDVLNYMMDMKILKLENGMVSISEELIDDEIGEATTLDEKITKDIFLRLSEITRKIVDYKYQNYTFFVTNLYFFRKTDIDKIKQLNCLLKASLNEIIDELEETKDARPHAQQLFDEYYKTQKYIISAIMLKDKKLIVSRIPEETQREEFVREMIVLWMIKSVYELIIVTFLRDNSDYLGNEVDDCLESPLVYGYPLNLSQEEAKQIKSIIEMSEDMRSVREAIVTIVKEHLENISMVNISLI